MAAQARSAAWRNPHVAATRGGGQVDPQILARTFGSISDHQAMVNRVLLPRIYNYSGDNGTATSYTNWVQNDSILVAPFPLRMMVTCYHNSGFNAAANTVNHQVRDQANNNITSQGSWGGAVSYQFDHPHAGQFFSYTVHGFRDYDAGETAGFRLAYKVSTSNIYLRCSVVVQFFPLA